MPACSRDLSLVTDPFPVSTSVHEERGGEDASAVYHLFAQLDGHSSDVKAVKAVALIDGRTGPFLYSASRDETVREWAPVYRRADAGDGTGTHGEEGEVIGWGEGCKLQGRRFINALDWIEPCEEAPDGFVAFGGLDSTISLFSPSRPDKPAHVIAAHYGNVSCLHSFSPSFPTRASSDRRDGTAALPILISASWDHTARVFAPIGSGRGREAEWQEVECLKGHEEAVWGAAVVSPPVWNEHGERTEKGWYATASADRVVRLFHGSELHTAWVGHSDVVRTVLPLTLLASSGDTATASWNDPKLIATASNDASIRIWNLPSLVDRRSPTEPGSGGAAVKVLEGHGSFVYSLDVYGRWMVSAGEDGTARVWDWVDGALLATVPHPAITVWAAAFLPPVPRSAQSERDSHDVDDPPDIVTGASDHAVRVYSVHPARRALPAVGEEHDRRAREVQEVVSGASKGTAKIEVVEPSQREAGRQEGEAEEETVDGERFDVVMHVDVSDDAPPLSVGANRGDDPVAVARDFVARHALPESYEKEIAAFVRMGLGE